MPKSTLTRERHPQNERPKGDAWVDQVAGPAHRAGPSGTVLTRPTRDNDAWVDLVADEVQALLRERGLDFELLVMFDPICEQLHAVGYDGAPRAYFAGRDAITRPSESPAPRGNPMDATIPNPAATRHETNEGVSP
ncbi:MAG: hypothetical protein KGJ23_12620 [Euryarchaeota archaeon]|nr:hypothetical protein [Euryarchaeota archaeon]MDE1837442.1 hypothetical protein [Euryarchaeota archaeon]MDE1882005.1 hypothetical protein [Euryarchaeota archaeon]MDE2045592.1 hypothetical protein [Thermoplasmata archaeon]